MAAILGRLFPPLGRRFFRRAVNSLRIMSLHHSEQASLTANQQKLWCATVDETYLCICAVALSTRERDDIWGIGPNWVRSKGPNTLILGYYWFLLHFLRRLRSSGAPNADVAALIRFAPVHAQWLTEALGRFGPTPALAPYAPNWERGELLDLTNALYDAVYGMLGLESTPEMRALRCVLLDKAAQVFQFKFRPPNYGYCTVDEAEAPEVVEEPKVFVRVWQPVSQYDLMVPYKGAEPMTRARYVSLMRSYLRKLIAATDPQEALDDMTGSSAQAPDLYQIGTMSEPEHWATQIMMCDQMGMALNRIDFENGNILELDEDELPNFGQIVSSI